MWFSVGSSNLFPPPSKDWLQNALSDPEGLGWGGEPARKVLKMCPEEEEDKEEESALLSLLDRGKLEEMLGPDLEAGVSAHVPQGDGRELEDIKTKLQKIEEAHERRELRGMEETEQRPQEEEREVLAEASRPLLSSAPCDNEATHLPSLENGIPFQGTAIEKLESDHRSVYVGNDFQVDYSSTAKELESLFHCCGEINRVTILCDKFSGHPKGYAYIEFAYEDSVTSAMDLDETTFRGRTIRVLPKRTNLPGISTTDRGGLRPRHSGRGGPLPRYGIYIGAQSRPRWRSHRGHGRFSQWFEPY